MASADSQQAKIKQYVRSRKIAEGKQNCFVCNRYKSIAEAHHLFPVKELVQLLMQYPGAVTEILNNIHLIWLCPNHHAIHHLISTSKQKTSPRSFEAFQELSPYEQDRFLELIQFHKDEVQILTNVIVNALEKNK